MTSLLAGLSKTERKNLGDEPPYRFRDESLTGRVNAGRGRLHEPPYGTLIIAGLL